MKRVFAGYTLNPEDLIPWAEGGYACLGIDIQALSREFREGAGTITLLRGDMLREGFNNLSGYSFIIMHPPCTDGAVSGARWFKEKGLNGLKHFVTHLARAEELLIKSGVPGYIEQPVIVNLNNIGFCELENKTLYSYWRKPDYYFHPYQYTKFCPEDNYTKKTAIWGYNGFVMPPEARDFSLVEPDDRIHKAPPGEARANFRSATPLGWARAVYEANRGVTKNV